MKSFSDLLVTVPRSWNTLLFYIVMHYRSLSTILMRLQSTLNDGLQQIENCVFK